MNSGTVERAAGGGAMGNPCKVILLAAALALVGAGAAAQAQEPAAAAAAGHLSGQLAGVSGAPVAGLFVTAKAQGSGIETTVYSGPDGHFDIGGLAAGAYTLTVHHARAETVAQDVAVGPATKPLTLQVRPAADPLANAPSSTWLAGLPDGAMKKQFLLDCGTCHEMSRSRVMPQGKPRDHAGWVQAIRTMKAIDVYAVIPPKLETMRYAGWLAQHLDAAGIARLKPPAPADTATTQGATITEYPVPKANELPHDVAVGPDRRIWITAFWNSQMWAMDPATGAFDIYEVNNDPKAVAQVRALQFDPSGALWMVNGGTKSVVRLDVKTRRFDTYPVGMYAHDLVLDSTGDIWVNDYFAKAERIAHLSHTDGKVTDFPLPSAGLEPRDGVPLPYGLVVDRKDRLWSTQLAGNTLVRYDIRSGRSKLYRMPQANAGPRRTAVGPDGRIWIPEFDTGRLAVFDPDTERFETFDIGDGDCGPYDVGVDQQSGAVWIAEALGSALVRFDPKSRRFERYPLPSEPAYMRHLAIDPETGDVWSAYSSLPTVVPKVVRLHRPVR
ncbi:MAG: carboxypeptidase regulatory-like domain-containing protein [Nevskia sp.]|nr:carboxypeptidase regulatory-like domain-containing protein [Nevskia sp.]